MAITASLFKTYAAQTIERSGYCPTYLLSLTDYRPARLFWPDVLSLLLLTLIYV